jgi:hypothetical protein
MPACMRDMVGYGLTPPTRTGQANITVVFVLNSEEADQGRIFVKIARHLAPDGGATTGPFGALTPAH